MAENIKQELVRTMFEKVNKNSDLDWAEIVDQYEQECHPDTLKKMGGGVKQVADAGMLDLFPDDESDESKLFKEKQKFFDLRREVNEAYRADARSEALRESVVEAVRSLKPINIKAPEIVHDAANRTLVVTIADMHYGAEWEIVGLCGETLNKYSPEIFGERMAKLQGEQLDIIRKENIQHVVLMMCGDSIDGMLRNSQLMKLRWGMVQSCMNFAEYMAQWIASLVNNVPTVCVDVYNVDGNHSEIRPLGSKRGEFENENLEKIISWFLSSRFENSPNVNVCSDCSQRKLIEIQGFNCMLSHGDTMARLQQAAQQMVLQYQKNIHFFVVGHKHSEKEAVSGVTQDGNSVVMRIPSICGMDGFAEELRCGGRAGATAMIIERGYGRRAIYPIML